jgi:uncharacterized protein (DUF4415 family)
MPKKKRVSSRPARPTARKRKPTPKLVTMTLAEASLELAKQGPRDYPILSDDQIDYSDIPALTDEELARFRPYNRGRPLLGNAPRKLISIKLDQDLIKSLKKEAATRGTKYQSLIHEILEKHFKKKAS